MKLYKLSKEEISISQYEDPFMKYVSSKIVQECKNEKGEALDIGCGAGRTALALESTGLTVTGIDPEDAVIKIARANLRGKYADKKCKFLKGKISDTANKWKGKFDIVICSEVIEHVDKPQDLVNQAWMVLKKGGILVLTCPQDATQWSVLDEFGNHKRRFEIKEIEEMISKLRGANIEKLITLGFPMMRLTVLIYDRWIRITKYKHGSHLHKKSMFVNFYAKLWKYLLAVDDLFNNLKLGTTILIKVRKSN